VAKRLGGESSWWRTVQGAKRPRLGAKRPGSKTSKWRNVHKSAERTVHEDWRLAARVVNG